MKVYFAPLEGITDEIYRRVHFECFGGPDRYYIPFISPTQHFTFSSREQKAMSPEENKGIPVIPQVLTKNPDHFSEMAARLQDLGYNEVNLNAGCPSGTVVAKGKGSGMLGNLDVLERFLDEVYEKSSMDVSIKTRVGRNDAEDWEEILAIFRKFPVKELTVHPRIQKDFYKGQIRMDRFSYAYDNWDKPLCYNGDIFTQDTYEKLTARFSELKSVMLGRGLLSDPYLIGRLRGELLPDEKTRRDTIREFHECLMTEYSEVLSCDRDLLYKMKELWFYLLDCFTDSEKARKQIRKCEKLSEYRIITDGLFREHSVI